MQICWTGRFVDKHFQIKMYNGPHFLLRNKTTHLLFLPSALPPSSLSFHLKYCQGRKGRPWPALWRAPFSQRATVMGATHRSGIWEESVSYSIGSERKEVQIPEKSSILSHFFNARTWKELARWPIATELLSWFIHKCLSYQRTGMCNGMWTACHILGSQMQRWTLCTQHEKSYKLYEIPRSFLPPVYCSCSLSAHRSKLSAAYTHAHTKTHTPPHLPKKKITNCLWNANELQSIYMINLMNVVTY